MSDSLREHDRLYTEADYEWVVQNCPICGRTPEKFLGYRGGSAHRMGLGVRCRVWRCVECHLTFPNPMPIPRQGLGQHYDVSAEDYFFSFGEASKTEFANSLVERAERFVKRKGTLLDVGSGRGQVAMAAKARGWQVIAVEPSRTFANKIREQGIEVTEKPIEDCELPDESCDVVICAAVLEHLYDPARTLQSISRLLRPGGVVFIDVPNENGLYFFVGNIYESLRRTGATVNLAPTFSPYHVFGFSPKSLKKLLAKHRLEPVHWHVYSGKSDLPRRSGFAGALEALATKTILSISRIGELGTFIEAWAQKK